MAKRIFIDDNYLVISSGADITDDIRNLTNNIYVEINGSLFIFYRKTDNILIESIKFSDILDASGVAYASVDTFMTDVVDKAAKPTIDVVLQSSTSPILIVKASNIISETTITSLTAKDDYIINVASATGFVVGQYLTIYNILANRVFFAEILAINVLAITIDTPLDFEFAIGSFVTVGNTNMNVDGSITPQIFGVRNPTEQDIDVSYDITRVMFKCLTTNPIELTMFGDIVGGLLRGFVARKTDGTYRHIFNVKSNADLKNLMYDLDIETVAKNFAPGFTGRLSINRLGSVLRLDKGEDLQFIIQDDLSTLLEFNIIVQGAEVTI